jgi:hypothetical protein
MNLGRTLTRIFILNVKILILYVNVKPSFQR